jgi:predicted PurR-regulated permease PerM
VSVSTGPRLPAGERLRRVGVGAWSVIGILILIAVAWWLLLKIRVIFPPLVLALLIIYLLNPIVSALERRGIKRLWGTLLTFIGALGGIALLVSALSPFVSEQAQDLGDKWPEMRHQVGAFIEDTAGAIEDRFGVRLETAPVTCLLGADETSEEDAPTAERCDEVTTAFRDQISHSMGRLTSIGLGVLEGLFVFILAPLLALYILIDLPQIQRDVLNLVPENNRGEVAEVANKIGRAVGGFFRGQLFVALFVGVLSAVGFAIIGLPFALVIGAIAGFFNLVPLVGPYIGGFLGFLVGTVTQDVSLGVKAAVVELIVQQIDNHIISPNVMRRTVQLHPATVMLSIVAGGALAGFWGVLLGVPAVAVGKILLGHVWQTRVLGVEVSPSTSVKPPEDPPSVVPDDAEGNGTEDADEEEVVDPA